MSKFKIGDKVIAVKNTTTIQKGWIGYVTRNERKFGYEVYASGSTGDEAFFEHELELFSFSVGIPYLSEIDITPQDIQGMSKSALDKQVSGSHYKDCGIQPIEYIHANGLDYFEGNAVKYITRHRKKNGKADIEKAIHYLELLLELEYKDK